MGIEIIWDSIIDSVTDVMITVGFFSPLLSLLWWLLWRADEAERKLYEKITKGDL